MVFRLEARLQVRVGEVVHRELQARSDRVADRVVVDDGHVYCEMTVKWRLYNIITSGWRLGISKYCNDCFTFSAHAAPGGAMTRP
jgi:hypothetical protein